LSVGDDSNKDQVYFLSQIQKDRLSKIIFPVGDLEKPKLRELAKQIGVRVYSKKDSQEICFVDDGKLKEFLMIATPLEHRTELFFNYGKLKFINDSKATNVRN